MSEKHSFSIRDLWSGHFDDGVREIFVRSKSHFSELEDREKKENEKCLPLSKNVLERVGE